MCKITKDKAFLLIFAFLSLILILMLLAISQATIREIDYENVIMNNNTQKQINLLNERVMKLEGKNESSNQNNNSTTVQYLEPGDCSPYISLLEEIGDGEVTEEVVDIKLKKPSIEGKVCQVSITKNGINEEWPDWLDEWYSSNKKIDNFLNENKWIKDNPYPDSIKKLFKTFNKESQLLLLENTWDSQKYDKRNIEKLKGKDVIFTYNIKIGKSSKSK